MVYSLSSIVIALSQVVFFVAVTVACGGEGDRAKEKRWRE